MYFQWLWSAWSARKMLQWQNSGSTKHIAISNGNFTWIFQIHFCFFYLKLPIVLLYTMNSYQNLYVSFCGMHHLVHNNLVFFAVLPSIFDYLLSFQTGCNYHFCLSLAHLQPGNQRITREPKQFQLKHLSPCCPRSSLINEKRWLKRQ